MVNVKKKKVSKKKQKVLLLLEVGNNSYIAGVVGCTREYVRQLRDTYGDGKSSLHNSRMYSSEEEMLTKIIDIMNQGYTKRQICNEIGIKQISTLNAVFKRKGLYYKETYQNENK